MVVGAGYTGTEVAAQGVLATRATLRKHPRLRGRMARWLLLDTADRVLPGLRERLSTTASRTLAERGVEIMTGTSVKEATADGVLLSDGSIGADPVADLVRRGAARPAGGDARAAHRPRPADRRADLSVPGQPGMWACGDAAAVPDLAEPGQVTAMTAQHAQRQGTTAGRNIAAALGHGKPRAYKHRNLGFVVDLGGYDARPTRSACRWAASRPRSSPAATTSA